MQREINNLRKQLETLRREGTNVQLDVLSTSPTGPGRLGRANFLEDHPPLSTAISTDGRNNKTSLKTQSTRQTTQRSLGDVVLDPRKIDDCVARSVFLLAGQ